MPALALIVVLGFTFTLESCKEIGPQIDFGKASSADTTYIATPPAAAAKVVLMEEFTGVRCINCAYGHDAIRTFLAQYPDRLAVVGVHSGFFANPYGAIDFRTSDGNNIDQQIYGSVSGQPAAGFDRRLFSGQSDRAVSRADWTRLLQYELGQTSPAAMTLTSNYDATTNKLNVFVRVAYSGSDTYAHKLSVGLTESGIKAPQLLPTNVVDTTYIQRHVLRQMLTTYSGASLAGSIIPGRVFERHFSITPNAAWRLDSCEVVAFVHKSAADSLNVVQAAKVKAR